MLKGVQANSNNFETEGELTWDAVNSELRSYGAPAIRYDQFDKRWQDEEQLPPENQILHNIVDRYDGHGLVLKTRAGQSTPMQGSKDTGQVSKMAKRATSKAMK